jgi:xanthine dehydrogenase accessory factor
MRSCRPLCLPVDIIQHELAHLKRSYHKLIWLNFLLGTLHCQPSTRRFQAGLPYIHDFLPIHRLASLRDRALRLSTPDQPSNPEFCSFLVPFVYFVSKQIEVNMRDILPDLDKWYAENKSIAIATVIQTWGSSPRRAGAKMALNPDGKITGSVSGGCVEGAVYEAGVATLTSNRSQLLHFGVADETAWEVGLACGGSIDIFVKPLDTKFFQVLRTIYEEERPAVLVTVIRGPDELLGNEMLVEENGKITGSLSDQLDERAHAFAVETLATGKSCRVMLNDSVEVFQEAILPAPTLIAVGGVHIAVALMALAKTIGYRTVVVDPRTAFGNKERFPHVDRLIQRWPDEAFQEIALTRSTAVAMLTHDPKLDDPALKIALPSPAFYVGALGSKATQAKRRKRLLEDGVTEFSLQRLHGPIGLELGAQTPEEIALSVMAEVVTARNTEISSH